MPVPFWSGKLSNICQSKIFIFVKYVFKVQTQEFDTLACSRWLGFTLWLPPDLALPHRPSRGYTATLTIPGSAGKAVRDGMRRRVGREP